MNTQTKRVQRDALLSQVRALTEEIERDERECGTHFWSDPISDPEPYVEATGFKMVAQGSDVYPEATGYHETTRARWSRTCVKCGKKDYTYQTKPSAFVPNFDDKTPPSLLWNQP